MEMYEQPELEIVQLLLNGDVITASLDTSGGGDPNDWIDGGSDLD